jgi:hypothetical protein
MHSRGAARPRLVRLKSCGRVRSARSMTRPRDFDEGAAIAGGAILALRYFACDLRAATSASLRSVMTPIWLAR